MLFVADGVARCASKNKSSVFFQMISNLAAGFGRTSISRPNNWRLHCPGLFRAPESKVFDSKCSPSLVIALLVRYQFSNQI